MREILKAFTKTTSGTVISLILGTVTVKILAVVLGPPAIGLLSLLRQIYHTTLIAATMSGQTALVQGGSTREGEERIAYLRTVLVLFLVSSVASAILLFLLAPLLASQVIHRQDDGTVWLVRLLAIPLMITVLNGFAMGILNIQRRLGQMAFIQIVAAAATALLAYPLALLVRNGHEWALLGTVLLVPLITFGQAIYSLHQMRMLTPLLAAVKHSFRRDMARDFYSFAGVTVITALLQSGVMLFVRSLIARQSGMSSAGIFDAAWMLSMTYVTLITTAFGTYYLPSLSSLADHVHRLELIQRMFRFVTVLIVPLILGMIALKPLLLQLLFSEEFLPAISLMSWMLVGDFFKLTSWVKAYPMLAFADLRWFFWSELFFQSFFLIGASLALMIGFAQLEGVAATFCAMYIIYYMVMSVYAAKRHGFVADARTNRSWWAGLGLIVIFSYVTWGDMQVKWYVVVTTFMSAVSYLVFSLKHQEIVMLTKVKLL